jgi:hypothetical protein
MNLDQWEQNRISDNAYLSIVSTISGVSSK